MKSGRKKKELFAGIEWSEGQSEREAKLVEGQKADISLSVKKGRKILLFLSPFSLHTMDRRKDYLNRNTDKLCEKER